MGSEKKVLGFYSECAKRCPKRMKNGPCGGYQDGRCEVVDMRCVFLESYDYAEERGKLSEIKKVFD